MTQAWAQNAVIISDSNSQVKYHSRCPYCNNVQHMLTREITVGSGITYSSDTCNKCYKRFDIKFGRN